MREPRPRQSPRPHSILHTRHAPGSATPESGFSLIEVLVALTILAISLAVIFSGMSDGLRGKQAAADYQRATALAESKLSSMGVESQLQEGQSSGQFDQQFRWEADVVPYREQGRNEQNEPQSHPVRPFVVTVTVRWNAKGAERSVSLSTLRLAGQSRSAAMAP